MMESSTAVAAIAGFLLTYKGSKTPFITIGETTMNISKHVKNERMNRMVYIGKYVGWGEITAQYTDVERNTVVCLTTTGVLVIKNPQTDKFITAYVARIGEVKWLYSVLGYNRIPERIYSKVCKNKKHLQFM